LSQYFREIAVVIPRNELLDICRGFVFRLFSLLEFNWRRLKDTLRVHDEFLQGPEIVIVVILIDV